MLGTTDTDVWETYGDYTFASAASKCNVTGTKGDTNSGTGVRTLTITGLSSTYAEQSETVTLTGSTAVSTSNAYLRINDISAATVGSSGDPGSTGVLVKDNGNTNTLAAMFDGATDLSSIYTVPLNKDGFITNLRAGAEDTTDGEVRLWVREYGRGWEIVAILPVYGATTQIEFDPPIHVDEKADIKAEVTNGSAANKNWIVGYDLILIDE